MSERFFVETPIGDATAATLVDAEAHHLAKVMRAAVGSQVIAFDGSGYEFTAKVAKSGRSTVDLQILERRLIDRELAHPLMLAVALPKGDRQKFLVEKLVELGVTRLVPLQTARGVAEATTSALTRLRRQVIEASKQCGRNRLMEIAEPVSLQELIQQSPSMPRRLLAHPSGISLAVSPTPQASVAVVGPEGGFTDQEVDLAAQSGFEAVSLGPRILRVETAAVAIAAAVVLRGNEQGSRRAEEQG